LMVGIMKITTIFCLISSFLLVSCLEFDEYVISLKRAADSTVAEAQLELLESLELISVELDQHGEYFEIYATTEQMETLSNHGFDFSAQINPSREVHQAEMERNQHKRDVGSVNRYHNTVDLVNFIDDMVNQFPLFTQKFVIGKSVRNRPLVGIRISKNIDQNEDEPEFKYIGNMHGDEVVGREICIQLINLLCTNYGHSSDIGDRVTRLIDNTDIYIIPSMNPDGFEAAQRANANGYDLNRNFPDLRFPSRTVGPAQPERLAVMNFTENRYFVLSANFHGGSVVANYPYDGNQGRNSGVYEASPDDDVFVYISTLYANTHTTMSTDGEFPGGITNGAAWYVLYGGMQDWNYIQTGDVEITIEVSNVKYPNSNQLQTFWDQNRMAMIAYMELVQTGVKGHVTNEAGEPIAATVTLIGREIQVSRADPAHGDWYRMVRPGTYTFKFAAEGYVSQTQSVVIPESSSTPFQAYVIPPVALVRA